MSSRVDGLAVWLCAAALASGCGESTPEAAPKAHDEGAWQVLIKDAPGALLRVAGSAELGVYVVGADAADDGPLVYHLSDAGLERLHTGERGSLWWWHQTAPDTLQMVGDQGLVLSYQLSTRTFTRLAAPVTQRLFGVWSAAADDVWYVGGDLDKGTGTVLHGDGTSIQVPELLLEAPPMSPMFKVTGFAADSVWMVGQRGRVLHCDGQRFEQDTLPTALPLLALSGVDSQDLYAVGGGAQGVIVHRQGDVWSNESPPGLPPMNAVWGLYDGKAYAAGFNGHLYVREEGAWHEFSPPPPTFQDVHAVWVDAEGGVWLAGGRMSVDPPTDGVLLYYGPKVWKLGAP